MDRASGPDGGGWKAAVRARSKTGLGPIQKRALGRLRAPVYKRQPNQRAGDYRRTEPGADRMSQQPAKCLAARKAARSTAAFRRCLRQKERSDLGPGVCHGQHPPLRAPHVLSWHQVTPADRARISSSSTRSFSHSNRVFGSKRGGGLLSALSTINAATDMSTNKPNRPPISHWRAGVSQVAAMTQTQAMTTENT